MQLARFDQEHVRHEDRSFTLILSAINDNWTRLKILHVVAREFLDDTLGSDFRRRIIGKGEFFPFDLAANDSMEKESQIVGMLMAWSVITLESLINHALAEAINNKAFSVMAIEYPGQITERLKIGRSARSELAKKLIILSDAFDLNDEILQLCDELSDIRNTVVHDKPFDYVDFGDGEVEIAHYRSRGESNGEVVRYDSLVPFFRKCDRLVGFISSKVASLEGTEISFVSLLKS
jgi:hypothetical protein